MFSYCAAGGPCFIGFPRQEVGNYFALYNNSGTEQQNRALLKMCCANIVARFQASLILRWNIHGD